MVKLVATSFGKFRFTYKFLYYPTYRGRLKKALITTPLPPHLFFLGLDSCTHGKMYFKLKRLKQLFGVSYPCVQMLHWSKLRSLKNCWFKHRFFSFFFSCLTNFIMCFLLIFRLYVEILEFCRYTTTTTLIDPHIIAICWQRRHIFFNHLRTLNRSSLSPPPLPRKLFYHHNILTFARASSYIQFFYCFLEQPPLRPQQLRQGRQQRKLC